MSEEENRKRASGNFAFPELALPRDQGRFGNKKVRFTILFALLTFAVATAPVWLSVVIPHRIVTVHAVVLSTFLALWVLVMVLAVGNYSLLNTLPMVPWDETFDLRRRQFRHIVIVPCFLEPSDVIHDCLDTLTFQSQPEKLVVVVSFELDAPHLSQRIARVRQDYKDKFGDFLIVVHELQSEHEEPGRCSNNNFALREAYKYCASRHGSGFKLERYTVTHSNTDGKFHPRYFDALEAAYNAVNPFEGGPAVHCVWQPAQFYNWGLEQRTFVTRNWRLLHSCLVLGAHIGFNLHPSGVYSYPLELGFASNFLNPRYVGMDVIAQVRWMCYTKSFVPVRPLGVPVLRYSGIRSMRRELAEWLSDARDSISAAAESFHYFLIHWRGRPFLRGLLWLTLFSLVKGFMLCAGPVYLVLAMMPYPWLSTGDYPLVDLADGMHFRTFLLPFAVSAALLLLFTVPFLLDASLGRWLGLVENVHPFTTFAHWVMCPVVLVVRAWVLLGFVVHFAVLGNARRAPAEAPGAMTHDMLAQQLLLHDEEKHVQYQDGGDAIGAAGGSSGRSGGPKARQPERYRNEEVSKVAGKSVGSSRAEGDNRIYI